MTDRVRRHSLLIVLLVASGPTSAAGEEPAAESAAEAQLQRLVEQLGDDSFLVREQASDELRRFGAASIPALRRAASVGEPEARYRASRLMEEIEVQEYESRLERFLEQPTDGDEPTGWEAFRNVVGDDDIGRELFAEAQRTEPELFRLLEKQRERLQQAYEARVVELQTRFARSEDRRPLMKHLMPLLFIGAVAELPIAEQTGSVLYSFLNYHEFQKAVGDGSRGRAIRKMLGYWIARPGGASARLKVNLALQQNLAEGLGPALRLVREATPDSDLQFAILTVGRFGNAEHVAHLEPLLDDRTVLNAARSNARSSYTCQVRDTALAVMLSLTGQDLAEYGFARISRNPRYLFSPATMGFYSEEGRAAAIARWHRWTESAPVAAPAP